MTRLLLLLGVSLVMLVVYLLVAALTERLVRWTQGEAFVQPYFAGTWWPIFLPLTLLVVAAAAVWWLCSWIRRWGRA